MVIRAELWAGAGSKSDLKSFHLQFSSFSAKTAFELVPFSDSLWEVFHFSTRRCQKSFVSPQDVTSDIRRVTDKVNRYLIGNCYAIKHSQHWNLLPEDLRRTLMERSFGGGDASRKLTSKPVLTSSSRTSKPKARSSPAKARTPVQGALKVSFEDCLREV